MNIETTTCIAYEHLELLQENATIRKLSLHTFIINFINYVLSYKRIPVKSYKRLQYRKRYHTWKRVHLYLYENEYEFEWMCAKSVRCLWLRL